MDGLGPLHQVLLLPVVLGIHRLRAHPMTPLLTYSRHLRHLYTQAYNMAFAGNPRGRARGWAWAEILRAEAVRVARAM